MFGCEKLCSLCGGREITTNNDERSIADKRIDFSHSVVEILNAVAVCVVESVVCVRGLTSLSDVKICKKDEGGEIGGGGGCESGGEELALEEEETMLETMLETMMNHVF